MIARMWRGWAGAETAERVIADLAGGIAARYASTPGNVSVQILQRPIAGGVEVMVQSVWDSPASLPAGVPEDHPLLVARETVPAVWQLHTAPVPVAAAA
jgi:heme-degrading monooxygenase HmoA